MGLVRWKSVELVGWGRVRRARSMAARPERISDLAAAIALSARTSKSHVLKLTTIALRRGASSNADSVVAGIRPFLAAERETIMAV